ncbi:MAG: methionyl-tRNA formyltransferase [Candidatus Omnitrophica bacterium]|nr:methionyl-tRNA formyltransferase [Candidatus Omnitrophota bacterium]
MNVVFFGTSKFAVPSLKKFISSNHRILAVITQPDRRKGRHLKLSISPVKEVAAKFKLKILQPEKFDEAFINKLKSLNPDIFIVIAFGHILKKEVFEIPSFYSVNLHASLLPKYRGAAPINWAIMNGETKTGVTIIKMNEMMDKGDIILQREVDINPDDTSFILGKKLSQIGADSLLRTLEDIENNKENFIKQNSRRATYARKLKKEDGLIDWKKTATEIHDKVRGLISWPGAYTIFNRKILKIWKTQVLKEKTGKPGEIIRAEGDSLIVGTAKGQLKILELQLEASKRMDVASFLRGHKISVGSKLNL